REVDRVRHAPGLRFDLPGDTDADGGELRRLNTDSRSEFGNSPGRRVDHSERTANGRQPQLLHDLAGRRDSDRCRLRAADVDSDSHCAVLPSVLPIVLPVVTSVAAASSQASSASPTWADAPKVAMSAYARSSP